MRWKTDELTPEGYYRLMGAEVYSNGKYLVILGDPDPEDDSHNCDAMGCCTMSHVLFEAEIPERAQGALTPPRQATEGGR